MGPRSYRDRALWPAGTRPPPASAPVHAWQWAAQARPMAGLTYSPAPGLLCECIAAGRTHVVVRWLIGRESRVIYAREEFDQRFKLCTPDELRQPDLFRL